MKKTVKKRILRLVLISLILKIVFPEFSFSAPELQGRIKILRNAPRYYEKFSKNVKEDIEELKKLGAKNIIQELENSTLRISIFYGATADSTKLSVSCTTPECYAAETVFITHFEADSLYLQETSPGSSIFEFLSNPSEIKLLQQFAYALGVKRYGLDLDSKVVETFALSVENWARKKQGLKLKIQGAKGMHLSFEEAGETLHLKFAPSLKYIREKNPLVTFDETILKSWDYKYFNSFLRSCTDKVTKSQPLLRNVKETICTVVML